MERKRARLAILDKEIKEIREKRVPSINTPEYVTLSSGLKNLLEKEEKEQRNKKQKKYNRDVADYKTQTVFNWQKKISSIPTNAHSDMEISAPLDAISDRTLVYEAPPQPPSRPPPKKDNTAKNPPKYPPPHTEGRGRHQTISNGRGFPHRGRGQNRGNRGYTQQDRNDVYPGDYSGGSPRWVEENGPIRRGPAHRTPVRSSYYSTPYIGETYETHYDFPHPHYYGEGEDHSRGSYDGWHEEPGFPRPQGFYPPTYHTPQSQRPNEALEAAGVCSTKKRKIASEV